MSTDTVLYIQRYYSRCGACGRNADPQEKTHAMDNMDGEGCGARFTAVASGYVDTDMERTVRKMRPDLRFLGWAM